jgi:hypothetical protein
MFIPELGASFSGTREKVMSVSILGPNDSIPNGDVLMIQLLDPLKKECNVHFLGIN